MVGSESLGIPVPGETMLITAAIYAGATHNLSIVGVIAASIAGAIIALQIAIMRVEGRVQCGRSVRLE